MPKTITIDFPGLSLNEVREKNKELFYSQSWYGSQAFANEKIPAGKWEVPLEPVMDSFSKTWDEQAKMNLEDGEVLPAAVLAYAITEHFKKTGERVFESVHVRTSSCDSGGLRVNVGGFGAGGLRVDGYWGGDRDSHVGLAAGRKLSVEAGDVETLESLGDFDSLSVRIGKIEATLKYHNLTGE